MGLLSGVGKVLNKITGADDSQKKSHKYSTQQQNLSFQQQQELNKQSYAEQEKLLKMQQAYDTQMANTAVKRQMNDYMASGINPAMVVAGGGAGGGSVSAPSASAGSTSTGGTPAPTAGMSITDIANSATSAYKAYKDAETGETQGDLNNALANKADVDTATALKKLPYVEPKEKAQFNNIVADTVNKRANSALTAEQTRRSKVGRFGELGQPISDQINNIFNGNAPLPKGDNNGKKKHWYGTRKDGK